MSSCQSQASHLSRLWNRLSSQHVTIGCTCSMSGMSVTLEDFERDIADYLWAESVRLGMQAVEEFILANGPIDRQYQPIRGILRSLEEDQVDESVADWLLSRLSKTIESYAQLHGPSPEAPLLGGSRSWGSGYRN
jgi:hypothetical protein